MENNNPNLESSEAQNTKIAKWLEAGNSITHMEALNMFQCFRLASRISDLRKRGMDICKQMILTPSGKRVAQYSMEGGAK